MDERKAMKTEQMQNQDKEQRVMSKLYRVNSTVNNFKYRGVRYDGVIITWFAEGRVEPPAPYSEAVEGLQPGEEVDGYPRLAVDELFTLGEAEELVACLQSYGDESASIYEVDLPLPANVLGISDVPTGVGVEKPMLAKEDNETYPFQFQVCCYFNIHAHSEGARMRTGQSRLEAPDYVIV